MVEFWTITLSFPVKILFVFWVVAFLLLTFYYVLFFLRIGLYKKEPAQQDGNKKPISIVVCVKDEYDNLKEKLFYLLEQEYPDFEVIIVNRASQDETEYLLKVFSETYPHLKIVNLQNNINYFKGKKFPLSIGIKSAKNDIILLTDADCLPQSYHWLEKMSNYFNDIKTNIVLGYSIIESRKTLFNLLQQYENATNAASCFGFAILGKPYTGFGKNLAYRKSFFFEKNGLISHYRLPMGEDSLFVNQNSTKCNTNFCLNKDSFTISMPQTRFSSWISEKRKNARISHEFKFVDNLLTALYPVGILVFYATLIALLALNFQALWEICFGILVVKLAFQIFCFHKLVKKLNCPKRTAFFSPLLEVFFLILNFMVHLSAFKNDKQWK